MNNVIELLLETAEAEDCLSEEQDILFLNGQAIKDAANIDIYQPFKPYASSEPVDYTQKKYDVVLIAGTKHVKETKYYIARGLSVLNQNGKLFIAADNKENGKRLTKWFQELGLEADAFSGNKAKCVLISKAGDINKAICHEWEEDGKPQQNSSGYYACPGLFSWEKIDPASRLLIEQIDDPLKGYGADFGCGYGYLSKGIAENHKDIKSLDGYDADKRALEAYMLNLKEVNIPINTYWEDLGSELSHSKQYDFIVMNPPFHEGRNDTPSLGLSFIKNAAKSLKKKGILWMVANNHLPYEQSLNKYFFKVEKRAEKNGFKVFRAEK